MQFKTLENVVLNTKMPANRLRVPIEIYHRYNYNPTNSSESIRAVFDD